MLNRLKTTIFVLVFGLAALLWGLLNLQMIFMAERDEARQALAEKRSLAATADTLVAASLDDEEKTIAKRYRTKSRFALSAAMLGFIIAALAVLAQWRKARIAEMRDDFVATVSHELKTPLASIRLMAETMEMREAEGESMNGYPRRIVEEVDSLSFLVDNILTFNRLGKDGWRLRKSDVHLGEIAGWVKDEADRLSPRAQVILEDGAGTERIYADPDMARVLFCNLARNAIIHNSGKPVRITVSKEPGSRSALLFSDDGDGIPVELQDGLFAGLKTGVSTARGSGLGLAICRRVMEAHGGAIALRSSGPGGTSFRMEFP